jgi:diacylglycerol kinase (ATP)
MTNNNRWRLSARARSFGYAIKGLNHLMKEPNAQIHAAATVVVIITGLTLKITATDWRWLIAAITSVWKLSTQR